MVQYLNEQQPLSIKYLLPINLSASWGIERYISATPFLVSVPQITNMQFIMTLTSDLPVGLSGDAASPPAATEDNDGCLAAVAVAIAFGC